MMVYPLGIELLKMGKIIRDKTHSFVANQKVVVCLIYLFMINMVSNNGLEKNKKMPKKYLQNEKRKTRPDIGINLFVGY